VPDPTIPDKAVTAAVEACMHARADGADDVQCWRLGLAAAVPHLADQPATTELAELREANERMRERLFELGPIIDALTHGGVADELVRLRRQSADRDTCTEPLPVDGDPEAMQTCDHPALPGTDRCPIHDPRHQQYLDGLHAEIRHLKQTAADRDTETAAPGWQVGDKAVWRGREVKVLAVDQVVIEDLGTALTRDADELEQHPDTTRGGE
jgi:hypothetical protein